MGVEVEAIDGPRQPRASQVGALCLVAFISVLSEELAIDVLWATWRLTRPR